MTDDQIRKLRGYYHSLSNQSRVLNQANLIRDFKIDRQQFRILANELRALEKDFPGVLPSFRDEDFIPPNATHCSLFPIQSYLAVALGKLQSLLDTEENTPVTQAREFPFVKDLQIRAILERDYQELQRAYIAACWKSVIILAGSAIEAILTDLLLQQPSSAKAATTAPKNPDITRWDLADLIKVSVELTPMIQGVEKLSHSVREYRNLVHPGNEIRNNLIFGIEEAKIALEVLHILHRDLS